MTLGILQQLNFCSEKRFTGKLCVTSFDSENTNDFGVNRWNIYFYRGRLVGDSAGIHPVRRWQRQFSQQQIDLPAAMSNMFFVSDRLEDRNHLALSKLLANNYIEREQASKIIEGSLIEVLFDIMYYEALADSRDENPLAYILQADKETNTLVPSILIKTELLVQKANDMFCSWQDRKLMPYSPNYTPHINDYIELKKMVPQITYTKVVELINGSRTLRDIAVKINEDVETIAANILKYCHLKVISLQAMPDTNLAFVEMETVTIKESASQLLGEEQPSVKKKLVAHLGDNDAEVKTIEAIVKNAGHDYINLQDFSQTLMNFLKCQPDLILVDNLNPKINADDLCIQLRRTNKFKDTPIVFLSESEGAMSWIRNKMNYSVEYIAKPLSHQKIFTVLNKYVSLSVQKN